MPLSWNEIKDRALKFSREWADEASEDAEAKSFWDGFFEVFGVPRRRVGTFEKKVKKLDGKDGFIDLLWKGVLLVEHKSRGKDLDRAHAQARDYFAGLSDAELPKYLLVSDFARFRLYDLETGEPPVEFGLSELHKHVRRFGFMAGYQTILAKADRDGLAALLKRYQVDWALVQAGSPEAKLISGMGWTEKFADKTARVFVAAPQP